MQTLASWRLGGAAGGTALRVYFGLLALAEQAAWHEFTTSLRRVAEAAGVGAAHVLHGSDTKPVRRALARLAADGLIELTALESAGPTEGRTVVTVKGLREEAPTSSSSLPLYYASSGSFSATVLHPCWERQRGSTVLGFSACRVWHLLCIAGPASTRELCERSGHSWSTVRTALGRLADVGLVADEAGQWTAVLRDLDEVAEDVGTYKRPQQRSDGNRWARELRQWALEDGRREFLRRHQEPAAPAGVDLDSDVLSWPVGPRLTISLADYEARASWPVYEAQGAPDGLQDDSRHYDDQEIAA